MDNDTRHALIADFLAPSKVRDQRFHEEIKHFNQRELRGHSLPFLEFLDQRLQERMEKTSLDSEQDEWEDYDSPLPSPAPSDIDDGADEPEDYFRPSVAEEEVIEAPVRNPQLADFFTRLAQRSGMTLAEGERFLNRKISRSQMGTMSAEEKPFEDFSNKDFPNKHYRLLPTGTLLGFANEFARLRELRRVSGEEQRFEERHEKISASSKQFEEVLERLRQQRKAREQTQERHSAPWKLFDTVKDYVWYLLYAQEHHSVKWKLLHMVMLLVCFVLYAIAVGVFADCVRTALVHVFIEPYFSYSTLLEFEWVLLNLWILTCATSLYFPLRPLVKPLIKWIVRAPMELQDLVGGLF